MPLLPKFDPFPLYEVLTVGALALVILCWAGWRIYDPAPLEPLTVVDAPPPSVFVVDTQRVGFIAGPMPPKPFPGQKKPPCGEGERTLNGGCWYEVNARPNGGDCPPNLYSTGGKCYAPIFMALRAPTSLGD